MRAKKRMFVVALALFAAAAVFAFAPVCALASTMIDESMLVDGIYTIEQGGDYVLAEDLDGAIAVRAKAGVTIDLAGHTITSRSDYRAACITTYEPYAVSISNGNLVQTCSWLAALRVEGNPALTLDDVNATSRNHVCLDFELGRINIAGGSYKVITSTGYNAATVRCSWAPTLKVTGGTFVNEGGNTIFSETLSKITLSGGTYSKLPEAPVASDCLVMDTNGAFVVGKKNVVLATANYRVNIGENPWVVFLTNEADAQAFAAAHDSVVKSAKILVTFDSDGGSAVADQVVPYDGCASVPKTPIKEGCALDHWVIASDGSTFDFSQELTEDVALKAVWRSATAVAQITDDAGATTTYNSLQTAVDAAKDGQTVVLIADVTERVTVRGGNFTLDLAGHTLANDVEDRGNVLTVTDAANVTLASSKDGAAVRQLGSVPADSSAIVAMGDAKLHINDGLTVTAEDLSPLWVEGGTVVVDGGTFTSERFSALELVCGTAVINGGSFINLAGDYPVICAYWTMDTINLTVNGGTFKGADDDCCVLKYGGFDDLFATINGGDFYGSIYWDESDDCDLAISGGTFSEKAIDVVEDFLVEGKVLSRNETGRYDVVDAI